jgi:DNA-binding response OmpR family regulator
MAYLMIIDDDEDFAAAVDTVLRDAGHEVRVETEISSAVRSMTARCPDLVVLDVMFPEDGTAGFQLARDMRRKFEGLSKVPILMLTAVNTRSPFGFSAKDIDEDWLPVTDFLEKPVDLDVLAERVSALLARPKRGRL